MKPCDWLSDCENFQVLHGAVKESQCVNQFLVDCHSVRMCFTTSFLRTSKKSACIAWKPRKSTS
jgi:hypothetical protein